MITGYIINTDGGHLTPDSLLVVGTSSFPIPERVDRWSAVHPMWRVIEAVRDSGYRFASDPDGLAATDQDWINCHSADVEPWDEAAADGTRTVNLVTP